MEDRKEAIAAYLAAKDAREPRAVHVPDGETIGGMIVYRMDGSGRVDYRVGIRRHECHVAGA